MPGHNTKSHPDAAHEEDGVAGAVADELLGASALCVLEVLLIFELQKQFRLLWVNSR